MSLTVETSDSTKTQNQKQTINCLKIVYQPPVGIGLAGGNKQGYRTPKRRKQMAILKFEINTDEIFEDYDSGGPNFEDLFKMALTKEVKDMAVKHATGSRAKELMEQIGKEIEAAVENKMSNLVNEEIALTDRWGKPTFVGSVEDLIKKQIDEKMFRAVDSYGKTVTGCSADEKTWVEWKIEKEARDYVDTISKTVNRQAGDFCKNKLDKELEKFKKETLSDLVMARLKAVGVGE